jgi:hypothetical protein
VKIAEALHHTADQSRWDAHEAINATIAALAENVDTCPCGHLDERHVHYCADDSSGAMCDCIHDYVRLSTS